MRRILIGALALGLAGCATYDADKSAAIRAVLMANIEAANAAGVDPLQLAPDRLIYFSLACATAASLSTIINPDAPELSSEGLAWCELVAKAAAPAGVVGGSLGGST